ncbi:MAG: DUF2079 domain-containing protein [Synechococcales cyanobacterium H12SWP_bin.12]|nr:DUF2079 domain-containing protein [Synechococcales cyanobacterium H12SWP_bin.12]
MASLKIWNRLTRYWPPTVLGLAAGFWLIGLLLQLWRLESFGATYDQALFLQELWSTAQGRPFESSLSSVLSSAVAVNGDLPNVAYLHLGQHANALTLLLAPAVAAFGWVVLPFAQATALTAAGLVLWRISQQRLPEELAWRLVLSYFLSGAVIGPMLENFHDLMWYPLLGFLILGGLLDRRWRLVIFSSIALLLVREDSGLLLFSIALWAAVRRPDLRGIGLGLMLMSCAWVFLVTGLIQPSVDTSLSDRFLQEKFGHLAEDVSGGTLSVLFQMLQKPAALLEALVSPPGATVGFLIALSLPLLLVPLFSVDVALIVSAPLLIALLSQGRTALAVTLRYVLALVPGLYIGTLLWWQSNPSIWKKRWLRPCWTAAVSIGLLFTLVSNPHRTFSAVVPDSFSPWVHVSPSAMMRRRAAGLKGLSLIPPKASVSADTPLLPRLAQREVAIRFPNGVQYLDREGQVQAVDWVAAFPGYYSPLVPLVKRETQQQQGIFNELQRLISEGRYERVFCEDGIVILSRVSGKVQDQTSIFDTSNVCLLPD